MNTLQVVILMAALMGIALAGVCTEECQGRCNVAKQVCEAILPNADACSSEFDSCQDNCDDECECPDQCEDECKPALDSCVSDHAGNLFQQGACYLTYGTCNSECMGKCLEEKAKEEDAQLQEELNNSGGSSS